MKTFFNYDLLAKTDHMENLFINKNHKIINLENIVNVCVISHTFYLNLKKLLTGSIFRRQK